MLREIAGASRDEAYRAPAAILNLGRCANRIAIRARARQADGYCSSRRTPLIAQCTNLRPQPALKENIQIAIAIEIGYSEGAAVLGEVYAGDTRKIEIASAAPRI